MRWCWTCSMVPSTSPPSLQAIPLVAAAGKPALVRIPVGDFATASRYLDAGASGVIAPMINTVEDARRLGGLHEIPAPGRAQLGPSWALCRSPDSRPATISRRPTASRSPSPWSRPARRSPSSTTSWPCPASTGSSSAPPTCPSRSPAARASIPTGAEVEKALDHALSRAKAANKLAAIYAVSGARAAELARKGFHMVSVGSDMLRIMLHRRRQA